MNILVLKIFKSNNKLTHTFEKIKKSKTYTHIMHITHIILLFCDDRAIAILLSSWLASVLHQRAYQLCHATCSFSPSLKIKIRHLNYVRMLGLYVHIL